MTTFEKKTVYHSQIVGRELLVRVPGPPRDSKYQGQLPFVKIEVADDPTVYTLNLENEDVRAAFELAAGEGWLTLTAGGSETTAWVTLGHGGEPAKPAPKAALSPPPPPQKMISVGRLMYDALKLSEELEEQIGYRLKYRDIIAASIAEIHVKTGIPLRAPVREPEPH